MTQFVVEKARDGDLSEILRNFPRFWGDRVRADRDLLRYLHHPMFFVEFGDTAFVARERDGGEIAGYLLGFVAPTGDGYVHFVATRDDARGRGVGRALYATFETAAARRGATALKALTSPQNERSMAFHRSIGFTGLSLAEDYGGGGRPRVVMRKPLA